MNSNADKHMIFKDFDLDSIAGPGLMQYCEHIILKRRRYIDEAILGEIKTIAGEHGLVTTIELNVEAAVEALKNYIPRDVIDKSDDCGYVSGACPKCGERLYGVGRSVKFCPYCGQKLKGGSKE